MKITRDDYLKIAVWWETNQTFDNEIFKSIKGNFYNGENEQIFGCWAGYFPIPAFSIKVQGKGEQPTLGGCNNFVTFLVISEMPGVWFWEIILLDTILY